jgi:hypothetical protein
MPDNFKGRSRKCQCLVSIVRRSLIEYTFNNLNDDGIIRYLLHCRPANTLYITALFFGSSCTPHSSFPYIGVI